MTRQLSNRSIQALLELKLRFDADWPGTREISVPEHITVHEISTLEQYGLSERAFSNYHWNHSKITEKGLALANKIIEAARE